MTILEAFAEVAVAVEAFRCNGDDSVVLSAVFKLNNEIRKQFRLSHDPALKALQLSVNEATLAAKRNDLNGLWVALERARACVRDLRESP